MVPASGVIWLKRYSEQQFHKFLEAIDNFSNNTKDISPQFWIYGLAWIIKWQYYWIRDGIHRKNVFQRASLIEWNWLDNQRNLWYISLLFSFHNSSHKYILNSYRKITRFNEHSNLIYPELGDQLRTVLSCWFSLRSWPKNIENLNVATLITIMSISDIMIKRIILITLTIVIFWQIKKRKDDHDDRQGYGDHHKLMTDS